MVQESNRELQLKEGTTTAPPKESTLELFDFKSKFVETKAQARVCGYTANRNMRMWLYSKQKQGYVVIQQTEMGVCGYTANRNGYVVIQVVCIMYL